MTKDWPVKYSRLPVLTLGGLGGYRKLFRFAPGVAHDLLNSLDDVRILSGDVVSFQKNPEQLIELLPELELLWKQWPGFTGISLHGFEDELN